MNWKYYEPKFEYEEKFEDLSWPWAGHKYFAYDLIANLKPKVIVELGTHYGTSFWAFSQVVKDQSIDTELNAVDTWKGDDHASFYGEEVFEKVKDIKNTYYSELKINLIRKTFDEAVKDFDDDSIDILHIDGLHTYEAVKHDFENWLPKVKKDGIILFHDIVVNRDDFGVYKLWGELKDKYKTMEFRHSYGLGILFKSNNNLLLESKKELELHYSYLLEDIENGKIAHILDESNKKVQEIQEKNQIIKDENKEIKNLNHETENLNEVVNQNKKEIKNLDNDIQSKVQEIENKDQLIQSKVQEIENKDQLIQSKVQEIENKDQLIQSKVQEIENKDQLIQSKAQEIENKDQLIQSKVQELENKDQQIQSKVQEIENKDQLIQSKVQEIENKDQLIQSKVQEVDSRINELSLIYSSRAWKFIVLIRKILSFFIPVGSFRRKIAGYIYRFCKKIIKLIYKIKEFTSRILRLIKKGLIVLRRDGLLIFFKKLKKFFKKLEISENLSSDRSDEWLKYQQNLNKIEPLILKKIKELSFKPLISIIVPVYNTPEIMLRQMLESVKDQLYPNWELCITDDGSNKSIVKKILKDYAKKDKRIRLYLSSKNGGVSNASNRALEMVTGKFVVLLDHDDVLEKQALFRVAESILEDDPDMVYSDEVLVASDLITVKRFSYRPMFSSEFLRSHPYIVHMVGFKTQLLKQIGGFDEKLNISQDYDLILRASEKAQTIVHIPEILYRWRIHGNSSGEQKMQEVMETSKSVLKRHMERCHEAGDVCDGAGFNLFDMRYKLINNLKVAIIIPTKNHGKILRQCIDSIRSTVLEIPYDIVVVDHESNDPETLDYFSSISSKIKILRYKGSFNFSTINNWAVSQLKDEYSHYLFCNNDIEAIRPGWLERMMELGQKASVGIVGAKLFYPDRKTIQHAGVCIGAYGCAEHYGKFLSLPENSGEAGFHEVLMSTHEVSAVTAACLLIQKKVFKQVLGFDESLAVGFGDVDLCLRVLGCGYKILYCPHAELIHHESYTRGKSISDPHPEDSKLFLFKWKKQLKIGDAYFNPGLSLMSTSWQTKIPLNYTLNIGRRVFKKNATFSE